MNSCDELKQVTLVDMDMKPVNKVVECDQNCRRVSEKDVIRSGMPQ